MPWRHLIEDLNREEIIGAFYEKKPKKSNQKEFGIEKVIKRKGNKLYVKWKGLIILLTIALIKMIQSYKMSYFPELFTNKNKLEVELDLSNYANKSDLKNATGVDTLQFAKKGNLADFKIKC